MWKKEFSQFFPSSLGCICCLIVWRTCKFGTNSNLIFTMILMNIIVYGIKCTQSAIITHLFSSNVGLFGILEMIKLFPTLIFIFGISLIKLTFSSIRQGFWSSSLIHASRFVFFWHRLHIMLLKLILIVVRSVALKDQVLGALREI